MTEEVQIIHRKNHLKEKVAEAGHGDAIGAIDPEAIKRAQAVIEDGGDAYKQEIEKTLNELNIAWTRLKSDAPETHTYNEHLNEIHRFTNHIKDIASTFSYTLMDYFACSLRDFSEHIDTQDSAHVKIVQAHIDVMTIVFHENIKDDGGPKAEELKMIVAQAIDKYKKAS